MHENKHISIVIPTHNRVASLETLLNLLAEQEYPLHLLEVIVVADGCNADTEHLLQHYRPPFTFQYLILPGQGPAVARNRGAEIAKGDLLLFLDDDIVPSVGLVAAHVQAHLHPDSVVIGYLPYHSSKLKGLYIPVLKAWWEEKFYKMSLPGYRFTYEDLLSANFSLPKKLFDKVQGFNEILRCREDYELGIRLLCAGARFSFSKEAWGKHQDEATDFHRSLWRKKLEGSADVALARLHPVQIGPASLRHFNYLPTKTKRQLLFWVYHASIAGQWMAWLVQKWVGVLGWLRFRIQWQKHSTKLQYYWYLRGVAAQLPTIRQLRHFLQQPSAPDTASILDLDLKSGLQASEELLDSLQPAGARIFFGNQLVGQIPAAAGAEPLRGAHLRTELAIGLALPLSIAIKLEASASMKTTSPRRASTTEIDRPLQWELL